MQRESLGAIIANMESKKKKWIAYLATGCFLIFGLACFVVGYGLLDGWEAVLRWFISDYAIMVYVALGLYGMGAFILWWVDRSVDI